MKYKKGIWIDTKVAHIVTLKSGERQLKSVSSDINTREREEGESKKYTRMGTQYFSSEGRKEQHMTEERNQFLKTLIPEIESAEKVVLFGPANMKNLLKKEVERHHGLSEKIIGIEDADNMTENQVAAWVDNYFNK